jgi:hypothetical protein
VIFSLFGPDACNELQKKNTNIAVVQVIVGIPRVSYTFEMYNQSYYLTFLVVIVAIHYAANNCSPIYQND